MTILTKYEDINRTDWNALIAQSRTATWFQTPEAYEFFGNQERYVPFVCAVVREGRNVGVCVGYRTFRGVIYGGPALAEDATNEEVCSLMMTVRKVLKGRVIYIEQRNFNDYSRWQSAFTQAGFTYKPHLNFHIDTSSLETVENNLSKNRRRDIRASLRSGMEIIEHPTLEQAADFYGILRTLYRTKVKTPLPSFAFFRNLYYHPDGRILVVLYEGKVVGGVACIVWQGRCVYEWYVAGMDGVFKSVFPSSVATYAGLKYAAENGCPRFDMMGAGKPDTPYGVREFKARFGGVEVEHGRYEHICLPLLYHMGEWFIGWLKKK